MITFLAITILFLSIIYVMTIRIPKYLDPCLIFLVFNLINYYGTLPLLDFRYKSDIIHFYFLSIGLFVFIGGSAIGARIFNVSQSMYDNWESKPLYIEGGIVFKKLIYFIIFISIALSILYYVVVGYNIFLMGVVNLITGAGEIEDVATLRLATYNSNVGGRYLFPGYINQLKNTILPLMVVFLYIRSILLHQTPNWFLKISILLSIIFIFGTGQRGAFVLASLMIGIFTLSSFPKKVKRKIVLFGGILMLVLFLLSSFFIGRNSNKGQKASITNNVSGLIASLENRISTANQKGSVIGFRKLMYYDNIQWGKEWGKAFVGLAPGVDGSNLSGRIFSLIYGGHGLRGNSPPSSWASIYYNFSWFGIVLIPFFMSLFLKYLYYRFMIKPKYLFRNLIYTSSFVLIGTWIAGSPIYYFNVGLFTIILLYLILNLLTRIFGKEVHVILPKNDIEN